MQFSVEPVTGRRLELNEFGVDAVTGAGLVSMEWKSWAISDWLTER